MKLLLSRSVSGPRLSEPQRPHLRSFLEIWQCPGDRTCCGSESRGPLRACHSRQSLRLLKVQANLAEASVGIMETAVVHEDV